MDFYDHEQEAIQRRSIEDAYQRHRARERWPKELHPDGCFYCGSHSHPTDCCPDEDARAEVWG